MSGLFERAEKVLPGGVNSPVRAFRGVGGEPVFVRAAQGAYLEGEDGRRYVDYIGGYGPHILGHRHPAIVAAIQEALGRGTAFGAPTLAEVEIAEVIVSALPSVEMVRLVNSGTEATMSALRLARAATGRDRFLKFEGCYHGHADPFLIAAGSGAATIGVPSSPGVPDAVVADTLLAPYNDLEAVERLFEREGHGIAAVIVEPVAGNMNLVPPAPGFLEGLRSLCDRHGSLLIFDEVMTGFRVAWGGAQNPLGVRPDLTTLGKVIGGGLPLAAYCGPRDLMNRIAPAGPVYQAGTLSGNPLAVAAGRAALAELGKDDPCPYEILEKTGARLQEGIEEAGRRHGIPCRVERRGSMLGLFFTSPDKAVRRLEDVHATDRQRFSRVFHKLLGRGVHLPPSPYEAMFLSTAHGDAEIAATLDAFDAAFASESETSEDTPV
ncbi:MAG TPA: glutamate-1-semialdehyde 2,1-aminomutase [Thermoanaerobaculia bacterium]|jgi:glutamate-1-semialdehyde 2,1-aminomutase|nr:glutamate-1-semialdehyde 2,1-aminomutase [Thermoanaerobaculia bacterium]